MRPIDAHEDGLYHADIGIPWDLMAPFNGVVHQLEYGQHARKAAITDAVGSLLSAPLSVLINPKNVFEVEVEQGQVVKFCVRLTTGFTAAPHRGKNPLDLVLVLMPSLRTNRALFVKTLWLNDRTDSHATLDRSKYNTL